MPITLAPSSNTSRIVLPSSGVPGDVTAALPLGVYSTNAFLSGAADQVAYTYKKLGGDVLDIELSASSVYAAYEDSCLEYSYIVNVHQAKNVLSNVLGNSTASFDEDGQIISGDALDGEDIALRFPKFDFAYARRVTEGISAEVAMGGTETLYSASFSRVANQQDYNLQDIISSASANGLDQGTGQAAPFSGLVGSNKVLIKRVYYKSSRAMWRFFGYYGGINVVGNMSTYGQWADDSTFQIVPVWQNKAQALAFEDAIYTRISHYSYELINNRLRIFPSPASDSPDQFWVQFTIPSDTWSEDADSQIGVYGINNMNTLPFENIPYININSMGKQWIRRFALALSKETLGLTRRKYNTVPIPGESVTLDGEQLASQGKEEQQLLREELKTVLDELTYSSLIASDADLIEGASKVMQGVPMPIFRG
tara:strand:+ start:5496 stop:6770 length:1275 start_codon:yes stop_codon:yes gene_type:complete